MRTSALPVVVIIVALMHGTARADSHEDLLNEVLQQQERMLDALLAIKDAASAGRYFDEAALLRKKLAGMKARAMTLPEPTEDIKKALAAKADAKFWELAKREQEARKQLEQLPPNAATEVSAVFSARLKEFEPDLQMFKDFKKTDVRPPQKDGKADAEADIKHGRYALKMNATHAASENRFLTLARERYGLEADIVEWNGTDEKTLRYVTDYNRVMSAAFETKFGAGVLEKLRRELAGTGRKQD